MTDVDETAYLTANPANAQRLTDAVERLEAGGGEIHDLDEDDEPIEDVKAAFDRSEKGITGHSGGTVDSPITRTIQEN